MVRPLRKRLAVVACAGFGGAALWRAVVAVRHQLAVSSLVDDPSARELEQLAALVEAGLALALAAHAAAAAFYVRRPFALSELAALGTAAVAALTIGSALARLPLVGAPGVVPVSIVVTAGLVGYRVRPAWASAYVGVALGSLAACLAFELWEPFVLLAVAAPPVALAFVGVGLGRLARRLVPARKEAET